MIFLVDDIIAKQIAELTALVSHTRGWMLRNYWRHLTTDGHIDTESMAEQAAYEFGLDRPTADDLAAQVAAEVDN